MNLVHLARWGKIGGIGGGITLAIIDGMRAVSHATAATRAEAASDVPQYRGAARAILDGTNLYEVTNKKGSPYSGPPALAVAMLPLVLFNEFWGSLLWYVLTVLISIHTIWLCTQIGRKFWPVAGSQRFWLYSLACLLVLPQFWNGLRWQNVSLLVSYLLIASLWLDMNDRPCWAGLCLAGGIVLKVFPALLIVYFIWKRRFRVTAFAALWSIVLLVVIPGAVMGWKQNMSYLRQWWTQVCLSASAPDMATGSAVFKRAYGLGRTNNHSVQGVLYRLVAGSGGTDDSRMDRLARLAGRAVAACLLLVSAYPMWRGRAEKDQRRSVLEYCLALLLMLLISPVTLFHYITVLALPVMIGILSLAGDMASPQSRGYLMGLFVYSVANLAVSVSTSLFTHGVLLVGLLALWGSFVWALAHEKSGELETDGAGGLPVLRRA